MCLHPITGTFAALTRPPVQPRIHPAEAGRMIIHNILPHFEIVSLGKEGYPETLNTMASGGWTGAKSYDDLLLRCAARCKAKRIYTFNLGDFRQLPPATACNTGYAPRKNKMIISGPCRRTRESWWSTTIRIFMIC
jgi:hypothetical protein